MTPSIKEALEQIIAKVTIDPGDDTVHPDIGHVLARGFHAMGWANPQAASCDMIEAVASALATFQPDGEKKEAIARLVGKHLGPYLAISPTARYEAIVREFIRELLASGLVQDEACIRRDEREKCAEIADLRYEPVATEIAAAIRSARNGCAET